MGKLKWLSIMLICILMTSCGKSIDDKIADGDELTKDDYQEMMEYALDAMDEINDINKEDFANMASLDDLHEDEDVADVVSDYPEVGTYINIFITAEMANDQEFSKLKNTDNYNRLNKYLGKGRILFWY
jgi:hypothetical protein